MITVSTDTSYNYSMFLLERLIEEYKSLFANIRRLEFQQYENITGIQKIHMNISDDKYSIVYNFDTFKFDVLLKFKPEDNLIKISETYFDINLDKFSNDINNLSSDYFNDFMSFGENNNLIDGLANNKYSIYLMSINDLKMLITDDQLLMNCGRYFKTIYTKIFKLLWNYARVNDMSDDQDLLKQYHKLALINYYTNGYFSDIPTGLNYEYLKEAYNLVLQMTAGGRDDNNQLKKCIYDIINSDNIMHTEEDDADTESHKFLKNLNKKD